MKSGCCRFGLWKVTVEYDEQIIHRVRFVRSAPDGPVPVQFTRYLAGKTADFHPLQSVAAIEGPYHEIYREVMCVPYGETRTYSDIAERCGTHARVVGNAMARNPTPLIVPCHRIVGTDGLGGFSPDIEIKRNLLALEKKGLRK